MGDLEGRREGGREAGMESVHCTYMYMYTCRSPTLVQTVNVHVSKVPLIVDASRSERHGGQVVKAFGCGPRFKSHLLLHKVK